MAAAVPESLDVATAPQTTSTMPQSVLVGLLECVASFGRSLDQKSTASRFMAEFSDCAQGLVPHDWMLLIRREDDGHTCSLFAEHAVSGVLVGDGTVGGVEFDRGDRLPADVFALVPVFDGRAQIIADTRSDPRLGVGAPDAMIADAGVRARLAVPLCAGGHVTGALVLMSRTAGRYTDEHVSICRRLAELIGPFVENVVLLERERRRRERLEAVTALAPILGASLKVGDVLERLGEAVRPLIDFDVMLFGLRTASGDAFERIGIVGQHYPNPIMAKIEDFSVIERLGRGEAVLVRDAERELDPRRAGDQLMIERQRRSMVAAPLLFGSRVGGGLLFASSRVHRYDEDDAEVAGAIATALVLAVQHQRLAERLGIAEARAQTLEGQVASLRTALEDRFGFDAIIGRSANFIAAVEDARKVAGTGTTVLLTGESGTGKEVLARAIHQASARAEGPFIALNCAALPETLVESELFGHERGAFTGADRLKRGRFERAAGGTLFLDEIGELAPAAQAKLLRVVQERRYERVGGTATLEADVRVVVATNRDLERAVAEGRFREDLYYRIAVFRVHLPALRERGDDVLLLAEHFVHEHGAVGLSSDARELLVAHAWPGNIRELHNALERALILAQGALIAPEHLGIVLRPRDPDGGATAPLGGSFTASAVGTAPTDAATGPMTIAEQQKRMIIEALRRAKGNKTRAAAALGLSPTQLLRRIRRFALDG